MTSVPLLFYSLNTACTSLTSGRRRNFCSTLFSFFSDNIGSFRGNMTTSAKKIQMLKKNKKNKTVDVKWSAYCIKMYKSTGSFGVETHVLISQRRPNRSRTNQLTAAVTGANSPQSARKWYKCFIFKLRALGQVTDGYASELWHVRFILLWIDIRFY